jgi:hypothetical protein
VHAIGTRTSGCKRPSRHVLGVKCTNRMPLDLAGTSPGLLGIEDHRFGEHVVEQLLGLGELGREQDVSQDLLAVTGQDRQWRTCVPGPGKTTVHRR